MKTIKRSEIVKGVQPNLGSYTPEDMYSEFEILIGAKIVNAQLMQSEVPRSVDDYLLLNVETEEGEELRLIFLAAQVNLPAPNDIVMWETDDFFDVEDMKARRQSQPFDLMKYLEE